MKSAAYIPTIKPIRDWPITDKRVTAVLTEALHKDLKMYSVLNGVTMQDVMTEAIEMYIQEKGNAKNDTFNES